MRNVADRIRHALMFEVFGVLLVIPYGFLLFDLPPAKMGVIGVASALVATVWNYIYNLGFDRLMLRHAGTTRKTLRLRIVHALLFEGGLLLILLPAMALYLQISLWQALVMDLAIVVFYLVYAFVFNWAYDWVFPVAEPALPAVKAA
ncbi:PACE efflux transporter [Jeongeupia naejangsanensis]|uniref:PACE efflux transporter n=1 Tax=Jeongeupia naejangsanensis TaxID=613195 RepID=A0ABS2BQG5_9NEIS|nr:PACE efflux transporter [Jeongeupia naejangsanensis]MBM3117872.1 PACE efflux transporter [Jeongeupia naejangsanensis]